MEETNKRINPIVIIILIVGIYITISVISKKFGIKEKANVEKTLYIPVDITKKYPKDFAEEKVAIKEIKNSIKDKKSQIIDNKEVETYYDSKGRIVYTIKAELEAIVSAQGGKGGYYYKRFYPEENGVIYDKSGHIIKKLETSSSYNTGFYEVASKEDPLRKSYLNNGSTNGVIKIVNISYNENGEKLREESVDLSRNYTKVITEYESEKKKIEKKIIDDETDYEPLNKIYVEITKEYDKNEKLIKKFVLRKNKFNAVRSETNFDFIKCEIVTKYYDGEKAFATVTETLIGKDRAIVKREREGDDVKIFDYVEYIPKEKFDYTKYKNYESLINKRYVLNNKNEILFYVTYLLGNYVYNDTRIEGAIDTNSYRYEGYFDETQREYYTKISSEINNIIEIEQNEITRSKIIEWEIVKKDYLKVLKDIMVGKLDETTKEHLIKKSEKTIKKEEINKEFKNIFGGM